MAKRKLYAVLCAINDYNSPVSKLKGCLNDAEEWRQLLDAQSDYFDIKYTHLYNAEAIKFNILAGLSVALENATTDDVVFFFYSGHGSRENTHDVFREIDSDGSFETLVCYDGITFDGELFNFNLIADKELHFVISQHAKPGTHVVFVMDSCHSGNITRNAIDVDSDSIRKRQFIPPGNASSRLSMTAPQREWSEFIFGNKWSAEDVRTKGWFTVAPQGAHIAMSACLNDESAYEVEQHGIFTTNLIKVLQRTGCEISYRSLQARVRLFVRNQMNQTPEIFATRDNAEDLLLNFLSKEGAPRPYRANCSWSNKNKWTIDLGSIHGMRQNSGPIIVETKNGDIVASLDVITANHSKLFLSDEQLSLLNKDHAYDAKVENYLNGSTTFYIDNIENEKFGETLSVAFNKSMSTQKTAVQITSQKTEAQYLVIANNDCITIAQNSVQKYPVWRVINDSKAEGRLLRAMSHIAKWEYIKSYDNPDIIPNDEYAVEVYMELTCPNSDPVSVPIVHNRIEFMYVPGATMQIRLNNNSNKKYFCALLYLSNTFEVQSGLIDGKVKGIQPGSVEWAANKRSIPVTMEQHVVDFKMPASLSYLKLIANEEEFRVDSMEQDALHPPRRICSDNARSATASRGLERDDSVDKIEWFTRTIELKVLNPDFELNDQRND